ncbi:hypothetical protein AB0D49_02415 [Streptomyces sp. NPDC048290]|uniref:hypothetical protein n=1 Tax=Streptomyces sp. NPDC048290 TaxID=3155811 RepID=UPI00342D26AB
MSGKNQEIERIDGEIKAIKNILNGNTNAKSVENRLGALERKKYVLGPDLIAFKSEISSLVLDVKAMAVELLLLKFAWDVVRIEIPSLVKLNDEKLLKTLSLAYNNQGPDGGWLQRLVRVPRDDPPPATDPTPSPRPTATTTPPVGSPRPTAPPPPRPPATGTTPTPGDVRSAVAGAGQVTNATNTLNGATNRLRGSMDG